MRSLLKKIPAPMCALFLIAACGGGGNDSSGNPFGINCTAISGGGTQATQSVQCSVANCTGNNKDAAIDNNLSSFATLRMEQNASGNVKLRATAQNGIVYPAGTPAAVVYGLTRTGGNSTGAVQTITTYLGGVQQETNNVGNSGGVQGGNETAGRRAMGTTLQFDAIELTYLQTGGAAVEIQLYEFCTSTN